MIGRSGLLFTWSTATSLLFSNMEIREFVGGSEVVSVGSSKLVVEKSVSGLSVLTESRRRILTGSPRANLRTSPPLLPPPAPPPACAAGLGLALRLAARVAAMKLALLGPTDAGAAAAAAAALLFPPGPGELRKSARRSLTLSGSSPPLPPPRSWAVLDPVVCLLSPAILFPAGRLLALPVGDPFLDADVAAVSALLSLGDLGAWGLGLGARLCRCCVFLACCG